ncbi:MAG: hypothetical protein O7E52_04115, partial [Candidatus Poribacteria bacterium]|nr:hypothetical protein [Candidatus Poribacteria bacterium]
IAYKGSTGRRGKRGILAIAVEDGKPVGEPYLINEQSRGYFRLFHWSKDGKITFFREHHKQGLYTVSIEGNLDLQDNAPLVIDAQLQRLLPPDVDLVSGSYRWSPDSQRLFVMLGHQDFRIGYVPTDGDQKFREIQVGERLKIWGEAVPSPDGTKVAFSAMRTTDLDQISEEQPWPSVGSHLYTISADGSNLKQLTQGKTFNTNPCWSPDGKRIAFTKGSVAGIGFKASIYVMDAEGGEAKPLTPESDLIDQEPTWSPDGTQIAFLRMGRGNRRGYEEMPGDVYVVPAAGGESTQLTFDRKHKLNLHGSPDGKYIAYDTGGEVWVVPATGGKARRLTPAATGSNRSRWSPDGKSLLSVRGESIWITDVESGKSKEIQLRRFSDIVDYPVWSPDGKQIAFTGRVVDLGWWRVQVKR